jgi:hypothetical protein
MHLCSGQNKNIDLAKLLIMKGGNPNLKNQIGDSALGKRVFLLIDIVRFGKEIWEP